MQVRTGKVDLGYEPRGFRFSLEKPGDVVLGGVKPDLVADPDWGHDFGRGLGGLSEPAAPAHRSRSCHG